MVKAMKSSQMRSAVRNMQSRKPTKPSTPPAGTEKPMPKRLATAPPMTPPRQKLPSMTVKQTPSCALDQPKPSLNGTE